MHSRGNSLDARCNRAVRFTKNKSPHVALLLHDSRFYHTGFNIDGAGQYRVGRQRLLHLLPAIDAVLDAKHRRGFFKQWVKHRDGLGVMVSLHRVDHQVYRTYLRGVVCGLYSGCEVSVFTPYVEPGTLDSLQVPAAGY